MPSAFSRRFFLRSSLERIALLGVASQVAACTRYEDTGALAMLGGKERALLLAVAKTLVPPTVLVKVQVEETDLLARIDHFLVHGDPLTSNQFRYLLISLEHYPQLFTTYFARFSRLTPTGRHAVLTSFAESRYYAKRVVFTALKSVICNHYYADPTVQRALGYSPACEF